jgi:hypothetical protein
MLIEMRQTNRDACHSGEGSWCRQVVHNLLRTQTHFSRAGVRGQEEPQIAVGWQIKGKLTFSKAIESACY